MASVIKWKYLRNVCLSLADGVQYAIPMRMIHRTVNDPFGQLHSAPMPVFDMDHVFETVLPDMNPSIPRRMEPWPESFYQKIIDHACEQALERRAQAAEIVKRLKHYASDAGLKCIEIVEDTDGVLLSDLTLSEAEAIAAGVQDKPQPVNPRTAKPSEIAAAAAGKSKR